MKIIPMSIKEYKFYLKADQIDKNARVIMSTSTDEELNEVQDKLVLRYDDNMYSFTDEMANKVAEYINNDNTMYILCDYGQSRSTAIAGALNLKYNGTDNMIWDNPKYNPNRLVYTKMLRALNIDYTNGQIDEKQKRNTLALRKAINQTR